MINFRALLVIVSSIIASFTITISVSATEYDAGKEFSNTQNPNGAWSYRGVTTGTTNLEGSYLLNDHGEIADTGFIAWLHEWGGDFLSIGNDNGNFETWGMSPGEGEDALMAFESQSQLFGESAEIKIRVYDGNTEIGGNGQILSIWKNNSQLEVHYLPQIFETFDIEINNVMLLPGDFLFVRLAADEDGADSGWDALDFDMTVSTTPIAINLMPPTSTPPNTTGVPIFAPVGLVVMSILLALIGLQFISGRRK
ncbi:MAG: hypothetical protein ABJL54_02650 [Halioglobus sp.]